MRLSPIAGGIDGEAQLRSILKLQHGVMRSGRCSANSIMVEVKEFLLSRFEGSCTIVGFHPCNFTNLTLHTMPYYQSGHFVAHKSVVWHLDWPFYGSMFDRSLEHT